MTRVPLACGALVAVDLGPRQVWPPLRAWTLSRLRRGGWMTVAGCATRQAWSSQAARSVLPARGGLRLLERRATGRLGGGLLGKPGAHAGFFACGGHLHAGPTCMQDRGPSRTGGAARRESLARNARGEGR